MRILRFGSVLGFASTVRFYHGFLNGLLMTFLGYKTTQWNVWLNLPELESSGKFLYTSSLATFSTLRRLLSIVQVGRVPDLRDFKMAVFITPPGTLCMHRKPNRVEGGPVFDWLTAMLRPVSHINRSTVPIPIGYSSEGTLSYLTNINMKGFRWFSKIIASLCFRQKVLALEG